MRIVVNDIAASKGGAISILKDFYRYIKEYDTKNEWFFLLGDNYIEETTNIKVITLPTVKKSWVNRLKFDFIVGKNYIKKLNPDIVFSLQNTAIFGLKLPQVMYIHQSIPFQDIKKFSYFKKAECRLAIYQHLIGKVIKMSIKNADLVIVQTNWMKKAICEKVKIDSDRIVNILPNVVDFKRFKIENVFNKNSFIYPTSSSIYKNNICIYRACEMLNRMDIYDFCVKLTIDNEYRNSNVQFIGRIPREQVIDEYNRSTLIFPSYIETFGFPIAEAKAIGTIILASDCEFSREILDGYENAYFFDPFKPQELASLMEKIIKGEIVKKKCEYLDQYAQDVVSSWQRVIETIISVKIGE